MESRVVIHKPGNYDALTLEQYEASAPKADEVSINVAATGINYADCVIRMGLYKSANELHGYPITPGFEVSGEVIAVGSDVTGFKPGDKVLGMSLFGGYCSQLCLPQHQVFPLPHNIELIAAAGIPAVYLTAWFALHELAHVRAGDKVLVHSGAGGVGLAALQLAKRAGADPVAVVGSSHKVEVAQQYGASAVIDKSSSDLWDEAKSISANGYSVIMDPNGYSTLEQSYQHLAPVGKLVIYGFHSMLPQGTGRPNYLKLARDWLRTPRFNPLNMTADNKSVLAFNLSFLSERQDLLLAAMSDILQGLTDGSLKPLPYQTWPLADVGKAHHAIESAQTTGKLLLIP